MAADTFEVESAREAVSSGTAERDRERRESEERLRRSVSVERSWSRTASAVDSFSSEGSSDETAPATDRDRVDEEYEKGALEVASLEVESRGMNTSSAGGEGGGDSGGRTTVCLVLERGLVGAR